MPEKNATTENADAEPGESGKNKTSRPGLGRRATRSLRKARATYEGNQWQDSSEASFLIQEATVLALMDLADAVREQRNGKAEE
jgi:hypothetical protein